MYKQSIKEKLLRGGAWAFVGKVATGLIGLAANALLARLLTPEEMGAYFLTLSLVAVASIVAQLGLTQTIVRFVAESLGVQQPDRARKSIVLALKIAGCSGFLVSFLLAFGGGQWISENLFKSHSMTLVMGLAAVWVFINTFQSLIAEVYRGFHDIRLATIFGGLLSGLLSMAAFLILWLLQGNSDLKRVILLTVIAGFSSVVLSGLVLGKKIKALPRSVGAEVSKTEIMAVSWPLWVSQIMVLAVLQADIWIVGSFLSQKDVALYGSAIRLATMLLMATTILYAFMPPIIAEMKMKKELLNLQSILTSIAFANAMLILPAFVFFVLFSAPILGFVYGPYYMQAKSIMVILAIGFFFNAITGMRGIVLMLTGHQKTQMLISTIGGVMNISFCIIGALRFGVIGVAYGAMFGVIIQCIMELIAVKILLGIWTFATPVYFRKFLNILAK